MQPENVSFQVLTELEVFYFFYLIWYKEREGGREEGRMGWGEGGKDGERDWERER